MKRQRCDRRHSDSMLTPLGKGGRTQKHLPAPGMASQRPPGLGQDSPSLVKILLLVLHLPLADGEGEASTPSITPQHRPLGRGAAWRKHRAGVSWASIPPGKPSTA